MQRSCKKHTQVLYFLNVDTNAKEYGREHYHEAKLELESVLGVKIKECGLFIDEKDIFLGVTPDGLIGENTVPS